MALAFKRHQLSNGLRVIIHEDSSTPLASCNVVYCAGSRDEHPDMTGMAHLFEHFMFTGSKHVPDYDTQLQKAGGFNNAYTTQDITHYYITLPAENIEFALWIESDRMLELSFTQEKLDIQKHVVIEEFKENFLNQPYGDKWLLFNQLLYKNHPYQWLPIGKEISHIEKVTMTDMKDFFYRYYRPNNAVLTLSGNIREEEVLPLVEKWFGDIPSGKPVSKEFPHEETQNKARFAEYERDVPADMLMKAWPMCGRLEPDFFAYDLLSDIFGSGQSSYLYKKMVLEEGLFTDLSAYVTGTLDPGAFVIGGRPAEGISIEEADKRLSDYLYHPDDHFIDEKNLQKVQNKAESIILQNEIKIEDRSSAIAVAESYNRAEDLNEECQRYFAVTEEQINTLCKGMFKAERSTTMYYKAKK